MLLSHGRIFCLENGARHPTSHVMEMGKVVLDGECAKLRENEDVKEFYLGLSAVGEKKSFKDAKHYKRRKRWLS